MTTQPTAAESTTTLAFYEAKIVAQIENADLRLAEFEKKAAEKRLEAELMAIDALKASRQHLERKLTELKTAQGANIKWAKAEIDAAAITLKRALDEFGRKMAGFSERE